MHPRELRQAYQNGTNISALLRTKTPGGLPTEDTIETAYDLQAGGYIRALENPPFREHKVRYGKKIAALLADLSPLGSLLDAGIGEATSLSFVLEAMAAPPPVVHGFDLAWSRVAHARSWLATRGLSNVFLSVARLSQVPYRANSFDVVLTSHALEPNRGQEETLLRELYRVTSRYLVLLEPGYELAGDKERARMDEHGYCRGLVQKAASLGMKVLRHELFGESANQMNPTALTLIEKNPHAATAVPVLSCPCFGDDLELQHDSYYSATSMRAYPIIRGIPCLRTEKAVIASKFLDEPRDGPAIPIGASQPILVHTPTAAHLLSCVKG